MLFHIKTETEGFQVFAEVQDFKDEDVFATIYGRVLPGKPEFVLRKRFHNGMNLEFKITDGDKLLKETGVPWLVSSLQWGHAGSDAFELTAYLP